MKFYKLNSLWLILTIFTISCSTKKGTTSTEVAEKPQPYKKVLKNFEKNHTTYKYMKSDLKIKAKFDGVSFTAQGKIMHIKGEGIFMQVKKLGFEIGRAWVFPDSVFVLNRWDKEYIKASISDLEMVYGLPGQFGLLEEVLTDVPHFSRYKSKHKTEVDIDLHQLELKSPYPDIQLYMWMTDGKSRIVNALYRDLMDRAIFMTYTESGIKKPPYSRSLEGQNIEDTSIFLEMDYRNPSFDSISLPTFAIPSHYTEGQL